MKHITKEDLKEAYLILKRNIYYDNSLIYLKKQIAEFEDEELDNKLLNLYKKIEIYATDKSSLDEYLEKIKFKKIIKKLDEIKDITVEEGINSEEIVESNIKFNYIIDCPIEIHILSIIWIINIGILLDKKISKYSYGYRLDIDRETKAIKRNFFKKYFYQYQKWSNNALKEVEYILNNDEDALFIKFDLKKCYYNISDVNLKHKLKENKIEDDLTKLILKINNIYGEKVEEDSKSEYKKSNILPIGLLSSAILANFYLDEIDENIFSKYNPSYYGRYVDDFIIVIKCSRDFKSKFKKKEQIERELKACLITDISLSDNKTIIKYFNKESGLFELEKYKNQFMENTSTFDDIPNSDDVNKLYKKISIGEEDLKADKFNISVYLTKLLYIYSGVDLEDKSYLMHTKNLKLIFSGKNIIKYYNYYMKLFIFFVLTNQKKELKEIYNKIKEKIESISINKTLKENSLEYLEICLEFALVYNPKLEIEEIKKDSLYKIFNSNIFNHKYINYPLVNYINITEEEYKKHNYFSMRYYDIIDLDNEKKFELSDEKLKKSPRFIHLDELNIFYLKKYIICQKNEEENVYINNSKKKFLLNFSSKKENNIFGKYLKNFQNEDFNFILVKSEEKKKYDKIKIGIASLLISEKESLKGITNKSDLSIHKKERIVNILNQALEHKVNILIFPEVTIPFQWLKLINEFSRKNDIVIIGGLEHIYCPQKKYSENNEIYNYLFTTLPFSTKEYGTSFIKIRLKNYYAPGEILELGKHHFSIPKREKKRYDLFSWQGFHFANFNCFELTDIKSRAMFKNYIDLLIASVFNKDITYFEKIIQSTCRDLHVYVAQSNTALYGDCGIVQPTKKDMMILSNIKGGINDNLLVTTLDIKSLREFQLLDIIGQDKEKKFKFLPPGIDPNLVQARIENTLYKKLFESKE